MFDSFPAPGVTWETGSHGERKPMGVKYKRPLRINARVVFYKENDRWIAHCLEFNLLGDGQTKEAAILCLGEAISIQIEHSIQTNNPHNLFSPADGKFFEMFAAGRDVALGEVIFKAPGPVEVGQPETREYSDDDLVPA